MMISGFDLTAKLHIFCGMHKRVESFLFLWRIKVNFVDK
jgi:hypothetical protein